MPQALGGGKPGAIASAEGVSDSSVEKPRGFFNAKEKDCVSLKSSRISGRLYFPMVSFLPPMCALGEETVFGAQVAGNDWKVRRGLSAV
jgi:hypothetical protein